MFKLAKSKSAQIAFAALAFFYGAAFLAVSGVLGFSAVSPSQYGEAAVGFEIEAMAGMQLSGAMLMITGLIINGRWRWSALARMLGALVIVSLCAILAWSAASAANGWPVAIYCTGFMLYGCIIIWWNLVDFRAALYYIGEPDNGAGHD